MHFSRIFKIFFFLLLVFVWADFAYAQTPSPIAHWKFDETSGTSASDSSGNGNNGMLVNGPTWNPTGGKIGGALSFDGTDDYVLKTTSFVPAFDGTGNLTLAAWIFPKSTGGENTGRIVSNKRFELSIDKTN